MGAINEILPKATGVGRVDTTSDGTGEIFNCYEGDYPNVASGEESHAEGHYTKAIGRFSHAEGSGTTASAECSHAEGFETTVDGSYSHAEGYGTTADGLYCHAEGCRTTAVFDASHAEGSRTTASGYNSHAEGADTTAKGNSSHAEGSHTQAFSFVEHAEGVYNKSYDSADGSVRVIHSVGIGPSNTDRKNAHEIKFNGDHYIYGLGNFDGTNSADAQTLQQVINSKQETITAGTGLEFEGNTLNVTLDTTVFKVVSALPDSPAQGDENKIHLVPAESTGANNTYTEYVWVNSAWEILGEYNSEVDLTPYLTKENASGTYATKSELQEVQNSVNGKQDTLISGQNIKSIDGESLLGEGDIQIKYPFPSDDSTYTAGYFIDADNYDASKFARDIRKGVDIICYQTNFYQIYQAYWGDGYWWVYARNLKNWNEELWFEANKFSVKDTKFFQTSTDETLQTTDKTVVGAINELASKPSGVGKVDPNSDGSGEIFNSYEGGYANVASGKYSHAEGQRTTASGNYSHAEGFYATASGNASHAEGDSTTASGNYSHAEGTDTTASGNYSHTEGFRTNAFNHYEHAEGRYNVSNTGKTNDLKTRHSVGIGTSSSIRKNAHEIMFNGDHYIYGLGGYDGTNATDISVKTLQRIIEEILINTQHPVIDYSAPDSAFTGTTLINSVGISTVNVWNVENYSRTDIFLLNSSGTTTDKIRYDVVRDTQYSDFQTAHEGDKIQFDEIIQLSTIVTNSFAESDLFIYHAKINDEPEAKYYLVDIVMTE